MVHFFKKTHFITRLFFALFIIASVIAITPVFAWTNPTSAPPTATPAISVSNGKVGIGTATPDVNYRLTTSGGGVKAENASATQPAGYFNNTGGGSALTIGTGGITLNNVNRTSWPSSGVGGSGTTNYIPKFTAGTTLGNSSIFDNGNVGIGTTTPGAKLEVNGQIKITGGAPFPGRVLTSDANGLASWANPPTSHWGLFGGDLYYSNGNVGIGTMDPTALLEIYGGQIKITGGSPGVGKVLTSDANGLASWQNPAGGFSGSGTANYLTKWTAGTTVGNSLVYDNGTNVGIGTTAPGSLLHISSTADASLSNSGILMIGSSANTNNLIFDQNEIMARNNGAVSPLYINNDGGDVSLVASGTGNVGVGVASPQAKFHVRVGTDQNIGFSSSSNEARISAFNNAVSAQVPLRFEASEFNLLNGNVGIGISNPASLLSIGGSGQSNTTMYIAGASGSSGYGMYVDARGSNTGMYIDSDSYGIDARSFVGVRGIGTSIGGAFSGPTGIQVNSCAGCSVLAEMVPVAEDPTNGDIMCTDPDTGMVGVCRTDKSRYIKGIAQKKAEQILRMGCSNTLDKKNGKNGMSIGVVDTDAWQKASECAGWYPIALSGLSEETNVVCRTPSGKALRYGDILVTSAVPGHLRPLDRDEDASAYQMAGKADSLCGAGKATDSIHVWVQ